MKIENKIMTKITAKIEQTNLQNEVKRICNWILSGNPEGAWYTKSLEREIEKNLQNESNRQVSNDKTYDDF